MANKRTSTTVTRIQLYDLVWSAPLKKIAEDLGTKTSEITRICDQVLHVPRPGAGYWQSGSRNSKLDKTPLPPPKPGTPKSVKIDPYRPGRPVLGILIKRAVAEAGSNLPQITVPDTLQQPHPQIAARLAGKGGEKALTKLQMRRYRIEDAFLKAMEQRGYIDLNSLDRRDSDSLMIGKINIAHMEILVWLEHM